MNDWKTGALLVGLSLLLATGIAVMRWHFLGQNWSAFIAISDQNISTEYFDQPIVTYPSKGYDGQFYFALAMDPVGTIKAIVENPQNVKSRQSQSYQGVGFDHPVFRGKRIVYPLLAWAGSGFGNKDSLPFVMVLWNILGIGLATSACFWINREASVPAVYNLAPLIFLGAWMCLYRDLAGQLGMAFALLSVGALYKDKWALFAVFGTMALFTKETTVFLLMGSGIFYGLRALRQKHLLKILLLGSPFFLYLLWSILLGWNAPPDDTLSHHFTWPFAGMYKGFQRSTHHLFWFGSLLPIAIITLEGWIVLWKQPPAGLTAAGLTFLLNFFFVTIMSHAIFVDPWSFTRNTLPLQYAAFLLIVEQRKRIHWATLLISMGSLLSFHIMVISRP